VEVPKRLKYIVARVRPEIANTWVLHHDNALSHASLLVREFLAKKKPWQRCPNLPTAQTWPRPISFCSFWDC
jgi:hypothetical protein